MMAPVLEQVDVGETPEVPFATPPRPLRQHRQGWDLAGRERRWATGFLGCRRMGFLPLVHQEVEGYEEAFEAHAAPPSVRVFVEAAMESGQWSGYAHQFMDGPSPRRFGGFRRAACAGPRSSGRGADQAHRALPHLGWMPERPAPGSVVLENRSLHHRPGAVHEASPNTSAATARRRNAAAGPIE